MIIDAINKDIAKLMKENNKEDLTTLKMAKNAIQTEKISKNHDLSEDEVILVLRKFIKQKKDDIEEYSKFNKNEVVNNLKREINLINTYLPEEMSIDDINKGLDEIFTEVNPTSIKDMGILMNKANEKFGSNADKALVSKLIKERLS
ncbi:MAG: GatB/YqeY domain-containing protein [Bacilli bacterium]|nr:GatB/YqeY domain-containing protein [Bacilli bacterium]